MSPPRSEGDGSVPLVPGQLRGYREFRLEPNGLFPLVQGVLGPWSGELQHAVCATGSLHAAPDRGCSCGLYAWYHPDSATGFLDQLSAVITAHGRIVLGERGFRAAEARIDAVALPWSLWLRPAAAARARRMLQQKYPQTAVYRSRRRMVAEYSRQDLSGLGIVVKPERTRRYAQIVLVLYVAVLVAFYCVVLLAPQGQPPQWIWPVVVLGVLGAQIGAVPLRARLSEYHGRPPTRGAS